MSFRCAGVAIIVLLSCLVAAESAEAAWYLAGKSNPQQNAWAKNESADPPVTYQSYLSDGFGAVWAYTGANRGTLSNTTGLYKSRTTRTRGYASFRLDDLVFSCEDGRTSVTYKTRLNLAAQKVWTGNSGGRVWFFVGDPDCPWGSCAGHWASSSSTPSWTSNLGGSGPLAGLPAGDGFAATVITGPARTASTNVPWVFSVSTGTEAFGPTSGPAGTTEIQSTASFPTDGPAFELPEGCTCNSVEGNIVDNIWMGIDLPPATVVVSGLVSSDCDSVLAGVTVYLTDGDGVTVSTTTAADGSYLFEGVTSSATETGLVAVIAPAGYEPIEAASIPLNMNVSYEAGLMCSYVTVSGTVNSDCDGALAEVEVTLVDGVGATHVATSAADGSYSFAVRYSDTAGQVSLTVPAGYIVPDGSPVAVNLSTSVTANFALECILVDLSGTISSTCGGALQGVTVDLLDADGEFHTTSSDASGAYSFADLGFSGEIDAAEVSISIPLGYEAVTPGVAGAALTLDQDRVQDFSLACLEPTGTPRSMGYWKHQANVYLSNKGSAQESSADMATNFPLALFSHFHENALNGIQVLGVTYIDSGSGHLPIDLVTIQNTLTVNKGGTMADRARQQYLAFLLNVASGKLHTSTVVSADGATASQALQQVAMDILDGDPANDESAKNIGDIINNAEIVPAGMIALDIDNIAYKNAPLPAAYELRQNHPNPFNPRTTIELALPQASEWSVAIFDVAGRLVRGFEGHAPAGVVQVDWDGTDLRGHAVGSGQYFYRAKADAFAATRKMTLVQ